MICSNCQGTNPAGAKLCGYCGTPFQQQAQPQWQPQPSNQGNQQQAFFPKLPKATWIVLAIAGIIPSIFVPGFFILVVLVVFIAGIIWLIKTLLPFLGALGQAFTNLWNWFYWLRPWGKVAWISIFLAGIATTILLGMFLTSRQIVPSIPLTTHAATTPATASATEQATDTPTEISVPSQTQTVSESWVGQFHQNTGVTYNDRLDVSSVDSNGNSTGTWMYGNENSTTYDGGSVTVEGKVFTPTAEIQKFLKSQGWDGVTTIIEFHGTGQNLQGNIWPKGQYYAFRQGNNLIGIAYESASIRDENPSSYSTFELSLYSGSGKLGNP